MNTSQPLSEARLQELVSRAFEDHHNGFLAEARGRYLQLLEYFPEVPVLHYNLGLIYYEQAEYEQAMASFALANTLNPKDADILFNLALSQKKMKDLEGAVDSFKRLLKGGPEEVDTLYNLAGCYRELHQYAKATETYLRLLQVDPDHPSAHNNLAYIYHRTGDKQQALHHYVRVLEIKPDHNSARHMVAALGGSSVSGSPDSYVIEVFDNYSKTYDHSLVQELEYRVPATLRGLLEGTQQGKMRFRHGLDLGCGTGLGGEAFGDIVEALDGLDLSGKMVGIAAKKAIYRQLHCVNIVDFLSTSEARYDFFLAADVFAYVGDLKKTFSLLKKNGDGQTYFCFSTEKYVGKGYRLQQSGRFAHSSTYIEELAGLTGWGVAATITEGLRKENGAWVQGDLWVLQALCR